MKKSTSSGWIPHIAAILLILVIFSVHLSSGMLARYRSTSGGSDSARVAVFKVTDEGTLRMEGFALAMDPADPDKQCATMELHNEGETAMRCTVDVETTGNLPLEFYIKNSPTGAVVEYVDIPVGSNDPGMIYLYVQWAGDDSYTYHRELDHIVVTISCTQID